MKEEKKGTAKRRQNIVQVKSKGKSLLCSAHTLKVPNTALGYRQNVIKHLVVD